VICENCNLGLLSLLYLRNNRLGATNLHYWEIKLKIQFCWLLFLRLLLVPGWVRYAVSRHQIWQRKGSCDQNDGNAAPASVCQQFGDGSWTCCVQASGAWFDSGSYPKLWPVIWNSIWHNWINMFDWQLNPLVWLEADHHCDWLHSLA